MLSTLSDISLTRECLNKFKKFQYDGDEYPTYDYNGEYEGGGGAAPPTQQTDYGQYYDYDYEGATRWHFLLQYF
jgi:hypothetical protein